MTHHPSHPQFLDVDWPQNHDPVQSQPLQLENEYEIDPSQYNTLLHGDFHPSRNIDRRTSQQESRYLNNAYDRQQFGGTGDYMFTFPNPQSQQFNQLYGNEFYSDAPPYPTTAHQSMPSSPYYAEGATALAYGQNETLAAGHARTGSNPGFTPTVRSFQDDTHPTPIYSNVPSPEAPAFGSNYGMSAQVGVPYRDQSSAMSHAAKRMRALDDGEGEVSSVDGDEGGTQTKDSSRPAKPLGACARCKGLKVKCEFKTDPDICKRCLNGGHECVIPGRKKRRAPPRRDLLLSQIREQAAKIEELMKQLEEANKRASQKPPGEPANAPSPPHSVTTDNPSSIYSELTTSEFSTPEPGLDHVTKPDVQDWIAKARESIEAFGGYINMGGPSVTKDMLGEDVLGWQESESEDEDDAPYEPDEEETKSDIHLEVEDVNGKHHEIDLEPPRGRVHPDDVVGQDSTASAISDTGSSTTRSSRRKSKGRDRLAILPNEAAPIGMLANLSLRKSRRSRSRSVSTTDDNEYGVASDDYFRANSPGPHRPIMYAQHQTPYILRSGLVHPTEVETLFKIFFDYMNPSISLLDPVLYTAQKTYWRSPFLFTVICGASSRYHAERPGLYQQAMNCARLAGGSTLIGGQKSVETVAAYLILGMYPVPARKWEEDRRWVYVGLAIRIATDLNLHLPHNVEPENEQHAREVLNRTRIWLNCFNIDRSISSQYGKAPIISNTDYIANHSEFFYKSSPYNLSSFDVHICGYSAELSIIAEYRLTIFSDPDHPVGLNKDLDIAAEASKTDDKLARLWETWLVRATEEQNDQSLSSLFRTKILKLAVSYARMTVLSFAFQHVFGRDPSQGFSDAFFWRCLRASKDLIRTFVDELGAPQFRKFLRHGPEAQCVFVTFTCAFLLKLLNPKFVNHIPRDTRVEFRSMVEEVAELLGHPDVAIDDRHGPKMYSRFLKGLLEMPLARVDHSPASLKRATRSFATATPDPDPDADRSSLSPLPHLSVPSSPPPDVNGERTNATPSTDAQMFDASHATDMYAPPLPFDSETLHSMQTLTDPAWSSLVLPGFSWMAAMQQDSDIQMLYNPHIGAASEH